MLNPPEGGRKEAFNRVNPVPGYKVSIHRRARSIPMSGLSEDTIRVMAGTWKDIIRGPAGINRYMENGVDNGSTPFFCLDQEGGQKGGVST